MGINYWEIERRQRIRHMQELARRERAAELGFVATGMKKSKNGYVKEVWRHVPKGSRGG